MRGKEINYLRGESMNNRILFSLATAALLHDIGKLGYGMRRNHYDIGGELLKDVGLELESYVAQNHHVRKNADRIVGEFDWITRIVQFGDWLAAGQREGYEEGQERIDRLILTPSHVFNFDKPRILGRLKLSKMSWKEDDDNAENGEELCNEFKDSLKIIVDKYGKRKEIFIYPLISLLKTFCLQTPSAFYYHKPDISLFTHLHSTAAISVALWEWINENDNLKEKFFNAQSYGQLESAITYNEILNSKFAVIVAADLSGIQDFIFSVTNKGAAKLIKGRSFIVSMIPEIVAEHILHELGLPPTQKIFVGGGNFYLLLPNTQKHMSKLKNLFKEVNISIMKKFSGQLYFNYATIELTGSNFELKSENNFANVWEELHVRLADVKKRKYSDLMDENFDEFFYDFESFTSEDAENELLKILTKPESACDVCGIKIGRKLYDETGINICDDCRQFLTIGEKLWRSNYIRLCRSKQEIEDDFDWKIQLEEYTYYLKFIANLSEINPSESVENEILYIMNFPEIFYEEKDIKQLNSNYLPTLFFYGGKYAPKKTKYEEDRIRTFSDLAGHEDEDDKYSDPAKVLGPKRLGVLKLDVDDLGEIFKNGFVENGKNKVTMDRLESLSLFIDLFFSYWLPEGLRDWASEKAFETNKYPEFEDLENKFYIIYSGGDDMFIVGSWDIMPYLAEEINDLFEEFVKNNPRVHLSAGLCFFPPKFPIKHGARITDDAESMAKGFKRYVIIDGKEILKEKNSIYLFDSYIPWKDFKEMKKIYKKLRAEIGRKGSDDNVKVPRSVLNRLVQIADMYKKHIEELEKNNVKLTKEIPIKLTEFAQHAADARWTWMLAYSLQRKYKELENLFKSIVKEGGDSYEGLELPPMEWLKAAVIWADWATRGVKR